MNNQGNLKNQTSKSGQTRPKTSLNPATLLAPVPVVLVSCRGTGLEADVKPNLITLAWAGTVCSDPPMVSISIRKDRFSHPIIQPSGEFVINLVNEALLKPTDFVGSNPAGTSINSPNAI